MFSGTRILNPGVAGYLSKLFPKILGAMPGCELLMYTIQRDHVRLVLVIPPRYAVSEVIGRLKGQTASRLREKFAWLGGHRGILCRRLGWMKPGF